MIIMPLGVGSATPTADRHLASVALWREGRIFLFDAGENAQMRMLQAGMKRSKIDYIFISHLDGDHFFGLPGLLTTMQLQRRDRELNIIAPEGVKEFVDQVLKTINIELCFDLTYTEIPHSTDHAIVVDESDFFVEARALKHSTFCVGYRFQEKDKPGKVDAAKAAELGITEDQQFKDLKSGNSVTLADGSVIESSEIVGNPVIGKSFVYITDTEFCENCIKLAENATILYHEATFGQALKDKAIETGHSTAQDAAIVAKTANTDRLVIGHFSARYTNPFVLLKEAKSVFDNTWIATELRPIMTDPEQEKDIFSPVTKTTPDFKSRRPQSQGSGYRQQRNYQSGPRSGGRNYHQQQGGRRSYSDRPYDNRRSADGNRPGYQGRREYNDNRPYDQNRYPDRSRSYDNNRPYDSNRSYDNRPYENRPPDRNRSFDRNRSYENRSGNPPKRRPDSDLRKEDQNRPPRQPNHGQTPITPRTPFDEFDRF